MRRVIVLALLVGAMQLVQPLGTPRHGAQALLAFGFLILGAYAAGELAAGAGIPKLVGYLVAGVVFGPAGLGTVNLHAANELSPISGLAIALIAFLAGAELRWSELRARGGAIARILATELLLTVASLTALLLLLRDRIPFFRADNTMADEIVFGLVFATIAAVHSPAVVMAMLTETRARGPLARTTLGVVLINDIAVVVLLTGVLAVGRIVVPPHGQNVAALSVSAVAWQLGGAVLVGVAIGLLAALYLRLARRELLLIAIVIALFGAEAARLLHVEPLLTLITAGFVMENRSLPEHGAVLRRAMERASAPVFVVFFALAGARISLAELATLWPLVLPIALVRAGAIRVGTHVGARWARLPEPEASVIRRHVWGGLIAQAGVAIGLAAVVAETYPVRGGQIRTLFLALVALDQVAGPLLFRRALARSGELSATRTAEEGAAVPAT